MANLTVTVRSSGGDYTSLNAAFAGEAKDLVTNTQILTIDCAGFADTTSASAGTGWTTSASYYINVVGDNQTGKVSTSLYRINITNAANGTSAVMFSDVAYSRCKYLEASCQGTTSFRIYYGIRLGTSNNTNSTVESCVIHDVYAPSSNGYGILFLRAATIRNNVIYNIGLHGINEPAGFATTTLKVSNNTIYNFNMIAGAGKGILAASGGTGGVYTNNLAIEGTNAGGCYSILAGTSTTNGSSDATGTAGLQSLTAVNLFTNITAGSEDFSLKTGAAAIGVGTDLSADFTTDITGATR